MSPLLNRSAHKMGAGRTIGEIPVVFWRAAALHSVLFGLIACFGALSCGPDLQPLMGMPLSGLNAAEQELFEAGRTAFLKQFVAAEGLGPLFNDFGCADCHNFPAPGGFSHRTNTRFGRADKTFRPLTELGGTVLQFQSTVPVCAELLPPEANVMALRGTSHVFGSGLIDALADEDLLKLQSIGEHVEGRVNWVVSLSSDSKRAGRFGWKSQLASLLDFSADASLEEIGLTNRLLPIENAPNGIRSHLVGSDPMADPEDRPDREGWSMIDRFTHFQQFLAPPPQTPRSGMTGERLFEEIGCAECHVGTLVTGEHVSERLSGQSFKPYSNFLLHDMGSLGDGIVEGQATEKMMRTAPLWGLAARNALLHDMKATGGSFEENVTAAIERHAGEAQWSRDQFFDLEPARRQRVFDFLASLGRAEFDWDRDHDVDGVDLVAFLKASSTCVEPVSADDPNAVFDVDQNGKLDLTDFGAILRAIRQSRAAKNRLETVSVH